MSLDAVQLALCEAAISMVKEGKTPREIAIQMAVPRRTLVDWLRSTPQLSARYAQAREDGWDAMAENALAMACDEKIDPKSRRVMLDAHLKMLSRWCPARYGEALLLKHEDLTEREQLTNEEIMQRLALVARKPVPLALSHAPENVEDAEFTDAE